MFSIRGNIILIMEEKDLKTLIQEEINDFPFSWIETVLRYGITINDLLELIDRFWKGLATDWTEGLSQEDLAVIFTGCDFTPEEEQEQIKAVKEIIETRHLDKLTFEEAEGLYKRIWLGDFEKMYDVILDSPEFSEFIKTSIINNRKETKPTEIFWHKKDFIASPFLDEIYKLSRQQVKELFG